MWCKCHFDFVYLPQYTEILYISHKGKTPFLFKIPNVKIATRTTNGISDNKFYYVRVTLKLRLINTYYEIQLLGYEILSK